MYRLLVALFALLMCSTASSELPELAFSESISSVITDDSAATKLPIGTLKLAPAHKHLLWADLSDSTLHLLERDEEGGLTPLKAFPMSIGKQGYGKQLEGDQRTPVGVYRFTSFLTEEQLDDFYGDGAYPIDYPNAWDRRNDRTGYGIWLHGFPKGVNNRPPRDSDGCVVIDNTNLQKLASYIKTGDTYLVIDESLEWQSAEAAKQQRADLESSFYDWLNAWQRIDNNRYLAYYAPEFKSADKNYRQWQSYKRRIHKNKTFVDVSISDLSYFNYPGEDNVVSLRYYQSYKSSNYRWRGWKEQLWSQDESGQWKIIYEGDA